MFLPEVDQAIEICERHLKSSASHNTEIETFLVRYLLVLICAEYEKAITSCIEKRAEKVTDDKITAFIKSSLRNILRGIRLKELGDLLGRFSEDIKTNFWEAVRDTDAQLAYDSILNNRHWFAHGTSVQVTFVELCQFYEQSKEVVHRFAEALEAS